MKSGCNDRGSALVFVTLLIVLLLIMVGMGLDTGHIAFIRAQGQPAVDAAALAAASGIPTGSLVQVQGRAAGFNYNSATNPGGNNYMGSNNNLIGAANVTLIEYDASNGTIKAAAGIGTANGARVALETANPYDATAASTPMTSPLFLTRMLNLFGQATKTTADVSVSAVAVIQAIPGMPIAIAGCPPANAQCQAGNTNCRLLQISSGQGGGQGNETTQDSGWTTFSSPPASAPTIKALVGNNSTCSSVPAVNIGQGCIYLNNGQITPILTEFESVYSSNGDGLSKTGTPYENDCGVIPVLRSDITNFNGCEPIVSFAKFCLRDVIKNAQGDKYLLGDLTCNYPINSVGASGCYVSRLVRDTKSGM